MVSLSGFPFYNQRDSASPVRPSDGQPSENASYNCVPTSLSMCITYLRQLLVSPDDLKDEVYGQNTTGGEDEQRYRTVLAADPYRLSLGFESKRSGTTEITDGIRAHLRQGQPTIVTMQSDWNAVWGQARYGGWHVGVAWSIDETDDGNLHIANPWGGFDHVRSVREWAARLGVGVWPVSKIGAAIVVPAGLGAGFAAKYTELGLTAGVDVPEMYFNDHESLAVLSDGTVFYYNKATNEVTADTSRGPRAPYLVHTLAVLLQAAKNQPAPVVDPTIAAKAAKYDAIKQALA